MSICLFIYVSMMNTSLCGGSVCDKSGRQETESWDPTAEGTQGSSSCTLAPTEDRQGGRTAVYFWISYRRTWKDLRGHDQELDTEGTYITHLTG